MIHIEEVPVLQQLEDAISRYLEALGEDLGRPGLAGTPERYVRQLGECLSGYRDDPALHATTFPVGPGAPLVTVRDIEFSSLCEHHLLPFFGTVDIAYVPGTSVLGLSKFSRVVDAVSRKLQMQERLTAELADVLSGILEPEMLAVKVTSKHACLSCRGVRQQESSVVTAKKTGDSKEYRDAMHAFLTDTDDRDRPKL